MQHLKNRKVALAGLLPGLLSILVTGSLSAQDSTGRIIGRVLDADEGRPLASAQVHLGDGGTGVLTDLDGRYVLRGVPVGTHAVTARVIGYGTKSVEGVIVQGGDVTRLDITLSTQAVALEGITISAARERGSAAFLLDQRRSSSAMVESVGAAEISRRPDSDAADVAGRMTGVTVSEGKYVFLRGLGERYSQTSFNGSSLPSPEPEREVVPLDLFPSGFLESMEAQKSYTPDQPADFSGGSMKIRTKDFPDRFTLKLGTGTSFNSASHFGSDYLAHPGRGGFPGLGDGRRDLPADARRILGDAEGSRLPADPGQRAELGRAFQASAPSYAPELGATPWNRQFDLSVGGRADAFDDGEIGYFIAGTYSDSHLVRDGEVERKWRTTAFDPGLSEEERVPNVDYTFDRGTRNLSFGTVGNVTVKPTPNQKVSLRTTISLNSEDEARIFEGLNQEDINGVVRSHRNRFLERVLLWNQLSGEHLLVAGSRLDWRLTAGRAERDEPFLREAMYMEDRGTFYLTDESGSGSMFWSDLVDDDRSGAVDWRLPFDLMDGTAEVKVGGSYRTRTRDFAARRLFWDFLGNTVTDFDQALDTAVIVGGGVRRPGEFGLREIVEPGDLYDASDDRLAGYAMVELPFGERTRATVGARVEQYDLELSALIAGGDSILADVSQVDVAPSVNLVVSPSEELKIRAAFSRTVDRPEFRELAPFQFTEAASLRQVFGNPELTSADITSGDLRLDWFPGPGEMISLGGFYKRLTNPIEQVFIAASSTAYSFQNAEAADVFGLELEARVDLGRVDEVLRDFDAQANYSWIDSRVEVRSGGVYQPTKLERPLEGQAAYVVNGGLTWSPPSGVEAGVYYNRFGERLEAAGGSGLPDIFETPRNSLDATLAFPLSRGVRAKLKATNLLDSPYRWEQTANGVTLVQREYEVGRTISVGFSWEL